jgi:hypothetical protein
MVFSDQKQHWYQKQTSNSIYEKMALASKCATSSSKQPWLQAGVLCIKQGQFCYEQSNLLGNFICMCVL